MANYANKLAKDETGEAIQSTPAPVLSNTRYNTENGIASSVISLHPNTSELEIGAFGGQGAKIRWIPLTETATVSPYASVISSGLGLANFDHYVPAGTFRRFVIPKETGGAGAQGGNQVGSVNGLYGRLAVINAGIVGSSIITAEF